MEVSGIKLIGINAHTVEKLVFTLVLILAYAVLLFVLRGLARVLLSHYSQARLRFWTRQGINVATTVALILGLISVWFDNPANLATAVGLVTAGLAFALQRVVAAIAGYLVILRGKTFNVGDRIMMGGVRGDVIALGFMQTTIMEMGQPPPVQSDEPAMWVYGRQFTGRIVTISNSKIFDEPVYNYSRDFSLIWEEMRLPISFKSDRRAVEKILIDIAERYTADLRATGSAEVAALMQRYGMAQPDLAPRVFFRITDNWVEMSLRFVAPTHGARDLKDVMSREILDAFDAAGIGIASGTYEIVGFPPIRIVAAPESPSSSAEAEARPPVPRPQAEA